MESHVELLDIARVIRNTIHNNGVYFHKSGNNETLSYKGRCYCFKHGKPVDEVGNWPFIIEIISDLVSLVIDVVRDSNIIENQADMVELSLE